MGYPAYIALDRSLTALAVIGSPLQDATNYPAANVANGILAKTSRLTANGGSFEVHVNSSPWINYNSVFVGNHSLTSTGTWAVKGHTATGSGGAYIGFGTWRSRNMWVDVGTQAVNSFVRVELTQADGTTVPIDVGEIVVGPRVQLPRAAFVGGNVGIQETYEARGITIETLGGVEWDYELSAFGVLQPTFRFPRSEYATFKLWSDTVARSPFVWIPDVLSNEAYYVKKERGFKPRVIGRAMDGASLAFWYDWTPTLRMQSEGRTVA